MSINIQTIPCGLLQENAYIVQAEGRDDCLVIDPGEAGYSDICVIPGEDPQVCVLYEKRWGTEVCFARFPLSDLFL